MESLDREERLPIGQVSRVLMAKYDVHRLLDGTMVVDCQSDHIRLFDTRVVAPLLPRGEDAEPVDRLQPLLPVAGDQLILTTHLLAAVPVGELGRPVATLLDRSDAIDAALDVLITGF
jgi:toxin CcdB